MDTPEYDIVIGLEVHAQLLTASKIYAADATTYGAPPNANVSVISLAHPGTLPKLNKKVVELAIKMGLACSCEISREQIFDRKNYFYPDLPKGYQLTQDRTPICVGGNVVIFRGTDTERQVRLNRIHIEEDAGKSIHNDHDSDTLIDLNRAGVPLIEIVTEPNLWSAQEAGAFLIEIRRLVRHLDVCDGNMEQGSLRCDANVSIKPKGDKTLGRKVEIKNLNSIKFVQKAIEFEVLRQIGVVNNGGEVISETRLFDSEKVRTYAMRTKEELNDYRYFPDPDLSPLRISEDWLDAIKAEMPALPWEIKQKLINQYQLSEYDAAFISESKERVTFFEEVAEKTRSYKGIANWMMGPIRSHQNINTELQPLTAKQLADLINLIDEEQLSFSSASDKLFNAVADKPSLDVRTISTELGLLLSENGIDVEKLVDEVLRAFPDKVIEYKSSKKGKALLGMFMGELMKKGAGKLNPKEVNQILVAKLNES
ncbi:MAG: Asp-tRNA(Asn)/Glu-tRNA(Gln) amidotransferase subunit GatB [Bacteroidota bacterium]